MVLQHEFHWSVGKSWRTWKSNRTTPTYQPTNEPTQMFAPQHGWKTWSSIRCHPSFLEFFIRFKLPLLYCVSWLSPPLGRPTSKHLLLDRSIVKKSTSLQSVGRSIARHALSESAWAMGLLEIWSSYGPGISGAVFGSGWWFWVDAVVCSAIKVPFLHYLPGSHLYLPPPPPSLSVSLPPNHSFPAQLSPYFSSNYAILLEGVLKPSMELLLLGLSCVALDTFLRTGKMSLVGLMGEI